MKEKLLKELKAEYAKAMKESDAPMDEYPWEDPEYYAEWLAQFYQFLCHATRLLCASGARLTMDHDGLHLRMIDHCQQEKTHERMVAQDLKHLGYKMEDFPIHPSSVQIHQSQYYLIEHVDPTSIFGCVLYLEGISLHAARRAYLRIKKTHGDKCSSFFRTHTQEDIEHIELAFKMLGQCDAGQLKNIIWSLRQTAHLYIAMQNACKETVDRRLAKKSA